MLANPAQFGNSRNHLDLGAGFVQQGRAFQGALPGTDHGDASFQKSLGVTALIAMRELRRRQRGKLGRYTQKGADPGGDYHVLRVELFSVSKRYAKATLIAVYGHDFPLVQVRQQLPLKPAPIVDKCLERNGSTSRDDCRGFIGVERRATV